MIEIYYYSGTGFTLKAAKILEKHLEEEVKLIPIVSVMTKGIRTSQAAKVGLLMPMHAFSLPLVYIDFLKSFNFPKADYIFSLVTRGGAPTRMHKEIDALLKKQGQSLSAFAYATTPNTFEVIFDIHGGKEDEDVKDGKLMFEQDIISFASVINSDTKEIRMGYRSVFMEYLLAPVMKRLSRLTGYFKLQDSFYVNKECTECSRCESVCLSSKIECSSGQPIWQKKIQCHYCLACLHLCPSQAIQVTKTNSNNLGRIYHPEVKWQDIANQKH